MGTSEETYAPIHTGTKIIIGDKEHCLRRYVKNGVLTTVEVIMAEPIKKGEGEEAGEEKEEEANVEEDGEEANVEEDGEEANVEEDGEEANVEEDEGEANVEEDEGEASDHAHHTHAPHKSMYTYFMKTFFFSFTHIIF